MKTILTTLLLLLLTGCVQVIHVKPDGTRLKINSFLNSASLNGLYHDGEFFEVGKYKGIPSDIVLEYDPLTKSFKFKAEKGK